MIGNGTAEVSEYQRAEALGLRTWDFFLNLGLAQLENGNLDAAMESLRTAVVLGEDHSESHFNLALVYERRGMLADAEHETLASLALESWATGYAELAGSDLCPRGEDCSRMAGMA